MKSRVYNFIKPEDLIKITIRANISFSFLNPTCLSHRALADITHSEEYFAFKVRDTYLHVLCRWMCVCGCSYADRDCAHACCLCVIFTLHSLECVHMSLSVICTCTYPTHGDVFLHEGTLYVAVRLGDETETEWSATICGWKCCSWSFLSYHPLGARSRNVWHASASVDVRQSWLNKWRNEARCEREQKQLPGIK